MLEQGMMQFALLGAGWVLYLLVALSVACIAISLERAVYLLRDRVQRPALEAALEAFFRDGRVEELAAQLGRLQGYEVRILLAALSVARRGPLAVEKAVSARLTVERLRMERGLALLATVGSNAPFLGLFGTVLGIIQAFHDLSVDPAEASEAVMAGISEALVATAVGLLVAIPAVVLYNVFNRTVRARLARSESLAETLQAHLEVEGAPRGE